MDFPKHSYQVFNEAGYPYTFEYPVYAQIEHKVNYFGDNAETKGWININVDPHAAAVLVQAYTLGKVVDDISPQQIDEQAWVDLISQLVDRLFG